GNQVAVAYRMRLESARNDEVGIAELARLVFDPEGLNALADELVRIVFFRVGKPGPGPALHEQLAIQLRLKQQAGCVTEHGGHFPRPDEIRGNAVHALVLAKGVHGRLSADEQHRIVGTRIQSGERPGILYQRPVRLRLDESQADQIVGRVLAGVTGIAPAVGLQPATLGAEYLHLVRAQRKLPIRMRELAPPKSYRPSGLPRDRRIGRYQRDFLGPDGIEDIERFTHFGLSGSLQNAISAGPRLSHPMRAIA